MLKKYAASIFKVTECCKEGGQSDAQQMQFKPIWRVNMKCEKWEAKWSFLILDQNIFLMGNAKV